MESTATLTPNPSPQGRGACQVMRPDPVFGRNDLRHETAVRPSPLRRGVGGEGPPRANITPTRNIDDVRGCDVLTLDPFASDPMICRV